MTEAEEFFVSGFCKAQNQTRTVTALAGADEAGVTVLLETDCAWGPCPHSNNCILIRQAMEDAGAAG